MIQSVENKVIVKVKSKYIEQFGSLTKIAAIQQNTSVHLEDLVNIRGEVVSLPRVVNKPGFSTEGINIGDTVLFAFNVIYDFILKDKDAYQEPIYRNMVSFRGAEYWLADITKIFGVIKGDEVKMVNGYVMAAPFQEEAIIMPGIAKKSRKTKYSEIYHIGQPKEGAKPIKAKTGDTIYYNPLKVQKYQINNKPFIILQQDKVLGILSK